MTAGDDSTTTGFKILSVVGLIDGAVRAAALTFVPFILDDRGMEKTEIFVMLILLLAGGAFGKYICGWFSERHGLISIVWVTKASAAVALGRDGLCADGDDSAAHGAARHRTERHVVVPLRHRRDLRSAGTHRARMYGYFYTTNEIGAFAAPLLFGRLADIFSIRASMALMGLFTATILPVSLALRGYLRPSPAWEEL